MEKVILKELKVNLTLEINRMGENSEKIGHLEVSEICIPHRTIVLE